METTRDSYFLTAGAYVFDTSMVAGPSPGKLRAQLSMQWKLSNYKMKFDRFCIRNEEVPQGNEK